MLSDFLTGGIFSFLIVFARLGAAMIILPGFGESYVSPRVRLAIALGMTLLVTPLVAPLLPPTTADPAVLVALVIGEAMIGLFLGLIARFLLTALEIGGTIASFQIGLSNALMLNPAIAQQTTVLSVLYSMVGVLLIFITDLHHLMIMGLVDSYIAFTPGMPLLWDDAADTLARLVARSFLIGVQIAAPFLVVGLVFYVMLGLLARLMPQMQVFFIGLPVQIFLGMLLLILTLSAAMLFWLETFQSGLQAVFIP